MKSPFGLEAYEDCAAKMHSIFWRRRAMIIAFSTVVPLLAGAATLLVGPRYTAKAVIQIDVSNQDATSAGATTTAIDGAALVESNASLIKSQAIARQVVERLHLDQIQTESNIRAFIAKIIGHLHFNDASSRSQVDLATAALMNNLKVNIEPRSYLVTVSYTAGNPPEAARIANAVVSEFLHNRLVQKLADRCNVAQRALSDLLVTFGDRHPLVALAKEKLEMARSELKAEQQRTLLMSEPDLAETGRVMPAEAITIPSSSKFSIVLASALIGGLLSGIAFVLILDRRAVRDAFQQLGGNLTSSVDEEGSGTLSSLAESQMSTGSNYSTNRPARQSAVPKHSSMTT
jgi:uncharacterized protein involved in exopolysaccharide biosynthesis